MEDSQKGTVYFLHIRKTAGTSFFKKIQASDRAPNLLSFDGFQKYFLYLSENKKVDLSNSMIRTHAYYGMHYMNFKHLLGIERYTYATILRDPVDRAISYYYYVKRDRPQQYEHPEYKLSHRVELKDFYALSRKDNEQTRILSGRHSKFFKKCNPWLLETAKKHLKNSCSVVGITEQFDETIGLFNQLFDWQLDRDLASAKVNPNRPKLREISEETLESLRECHKFDLELYDFAKQLFAQQLSQAGEQKANTPV